MLVRSMLAAGAALLLANIPANACLPDAKPKSLDDMRKMARRAFFESALIVDAEVLNPSRGQVPATLRLTRNLKGNAPAIVQIFAAGDCEIDLTRPGAHVRLVLRGGPQVYRASYFDNGTGVFDADQRKAFAEALDQLIGRPRDAAAD